MHKAKHSLAGTLTYTISVSIPGEPSALILPNVNVGTTFGGLKELVWKTKTWDDKQKPRKAFTWRVQNGEMYFADDDMITSLVHVSAMFREGAGASGAIAPTLIPQEICLYPVADIADKVKRETLLCSQSPVLYHGNLNKLGEGLLAGWTRRYFVLQDNTLFYFADEKTYADGKGKEKAKGFIPMPCLFVPHNNYKGQTLVFELQAKHLGKRNFFMSAESQESFDGWRRVCQSMSLRRAKSVTAAVCEEFITRGVGELEYVFQLPGAAAVVQQLKTAFDHGETVRLGDITDHKAMAEVLKLSLRETLAEPLLSFTLFPRWVQVGGEEQARIAEVRTLLALLPSATQSFLEFLMGFLGKVAHASITNMMTAKLLAICLGPTLMRSEDPNAKPLEAYLALETMMEHWRAVFTSAEEEKKALKPLMETPAPAPAATAAAPVNDGRPKDGPVSAADAAAFLKRYQLANGNWEKDWRVRQKLIMNGLGEMHSKLKSSGGGTLPSGLGEMNNAFLVEAEWRAESIATCDELITRLNKLTALVQHASAQG